MIRAIAIKLVVGKDDVVIAGAQQAVVERYLVIVLAGYFTS